MEGPFCPLNYCTFAEPEVATYCIHLQRPQLRDAAESDELVPGMSRCRGLPEVATRDSNRNALAKSVHFRLAWPVEDALPATHLPAPASFAELTEAGRHPPGDLRAKVPKISLAV